MELLQAHPYTGKGSFPMTKQTTGMKHNNSMHYSNNPYAKKSKRKKKNLFHMNDPTAT